MTAIKGNSLVSGLHHGSLLLPSPVVPGIYKMHPEVSAKCIMEVKSPVGQCWWRQHTPVWWSTHWWCPPGELLLLAQCKLGRRPTRKKQIPSLQEKQGHEDFKGLSKHLTVRPLYGLQVLLKAITSLAFPIAPQRVCQTIPFPSQAALALLTALPVPCDV